MRFPGETWLAVGKWLTLMKANWAYLFWDANPAFYLAAEYIPRRVYFAIKL